MTSKGAKTHIIDTINGDMNKEYFINELLPEILKDLDRLEKLEKALEILKKIFEFEAKIGQYPIEEYYFVDYFRASDTEVSKQEYELLKEVLECQKD